MDKKSKKIDIEKYVEALVATTPDKGTQVILFAKETRQIIYLPLWVFDNDEPAYRLLTKTEKTPIFDDELLSELILNVGDDLYTLCSKYHKEEEENDLQRIRVALVDYFFDVFERSKRPKPYLHSPTERPRQLKHTAGVVQEALALAGLSMVGAFVFSAYTVTTVTQKTDRLIEALHAASLSSHAALVDEGESCDMDDEGEWLPTTFFNEVTEPEETVKPKPLDVFNHQVKKVDQSNNQKAALSSNASVELTKTAVKPAPITEPAPTISPSAQLTSAGQMDVISLNVLYRLSAKHALIMGDASQTQQTQTPYLVFSALEDAPLMDALWGTVRDGFTAVVVPTISGDSEQAEIMRAAAAFCVREGGGLKPILTASFDDLVQVHTPSSQCDWQGALDAYLDMNAMADLKGLEDGSFPLIIAPNGKISRIDQTQPLYSTSISEWLRATKEENQKGAR